MLLVLLLLYPVTGVGVGDGDGGVLVLWNMMCGVQHLPALSTCLVVLHVALTPAWYSTVGCRDQRRQC